MNISELSTGEYFILRDSLEYNVYQVIEPVSLSSITNVNALYIGRLELGTDNYISLIPTLTEFSLFTEIVQVDVFIKVRGRL